jgi:hypothetical protein
VIILILSFSAAQAQRITQTYNDVSLSEALLQLSREQTDYTISFIYNELEDFRITATIKNKKLPDAIQQMIGFYPVRMTEKPDDKEIFVECTHKTDRHLTGTIIDENDQPVAYANVALLNPADSTLLSGGVSNESGYFAIPYEQPTVLARISYVGYKTIYKLCDQPEVGSIRMQPDNYIINGLQVKGERIIVKAENGHLTYSIPQLLEILPADNAYEALTRIPGVIDNGDELTFTGRSVTLIINGKPTTLSSEQVIERLKQMPASQLAKAEVLPSAPAKYHVRGMAINVITKDYVGTHQLLGQLQGFYRQNKYGYGQAKGNLIYQHGNFGMDASYAFGYGDAYGKTEHEAHHPLGGQRVDYFDKTERKNQTLNYNYRIGMDYAFSKESRLNVAYTGKWTSNDATNTSTGLETSVQKSKLHNYLHNVDASYSAPFGLQLGASYTNYQNPRTQNLDSKLYNETRNLTAESQQRISKWLFTADQTHKLPNDWELNYGVEAQFTDNDSYQTTLDAAGSELPDATSHVNYDERILDIYTGFSKQFSDAFSLEASVAAENYHATKWNDWRIYPSLSAMWNINENNLINFSLGSETVYPTYWSTMSSIFYSSAYSEIWGNPDLKPRPSYELNLMWQLNHKYTFLAFAELKPDYFVQLAYQPSDRMAVIMKEDNWDYSNSSGLQVSAQYSFGKWLNGNVMGTMLYRHDKSTDFFDLPFNRTCLSAILSGTAVIRFSSRQNIQLIFNPLFQSKTIQGVYDIDPLFRLNASLRWTSDNKKWSVIAAGQNITNSRVITHSRLENQDYSMRVWMEVPNVSLTAIYRIGNFKEKKTKSVDTSRMGY